MRTAADVCDIPTTATLDCSSSALESGSDESQSTPAYADEHSWLTRVRDGDEEAARALVHRLYPTVLKSVRRHRSARASEEDLAQAVFAKVFAKLHQFSGRVPLEHWVSRISVNTCLSQLSREKLRPELRMSDLAERDEASVQQLLSTECNGYVDGGREARELLEKLFAPLTRDERLVVTLLHLEEHSVHRITALTGWSASRVKVKAFRARRKMRKLWKRLVASGGWEDQLSE
jgi:RNA polymerase sigma-70 factor (ECF subfamily)